MLAKIYSGALVGLDSLLIEVETDVSGGSLPSFTIVGLPDKAVEEAKERVRSAIKNSGATFPSKRLIVNLAPADLPKEGPSYDLPIAIGILIASGQIEADVSDALILGELSLDGSLRHTNGILSQVQLAKERGLKKIFLPAVDAAEAVIIGGIDIIPVASLLDVYNHVTKQKQIQPYQGNADVLLSPEENSYAFDMKDIQGQEQAKRALEIAAAGGHNIFMKGPPGAGKTLLARTLPSILPRMEPIEALEVTKIYSVSGLLAPSEPLVRTRPFRAPHHTTSHIGLVGGGTHPRPGEISLSHRGVLFLDEFPEFSRQALEAMRQPLEDGYISVSRAKGTCIFPTKFMLVAASNPCPCGFLGDPKKECTCMPSHIAHYQKRISGPILDRIDIHLDVPAVRVEKLTAAVAVTSEDSKTIRERVQHARSKQTTRFSGTKLTCNAEMSTRDIKEYCPLNEESLALLRQAVSQFGLSARSFYRVIKLARTISDLAQEKEITLSHLAEALQYRPKIDK